MNLKKIALCIVGLAVSASIYAAPKADVVECPAADSIKMVFFDEALPSIFNDDSHWTGLIRNNKFATDNEWSFIFGEVKASDATTALKILNEKVQDITFNYKLESGGEMTLCYYKVEDESLTKYGFAITPPLPIMDMMKIMRR